MCQQENQDATLVRRHVLINGLPWERPLRQTHRTQWTQVIIFADVHGDPRSKKKSTLSLKYLRMRKRWLPDIIRQFPYGSTIYFVQDSAGIHHGSVVKNWWMQIEHHGIS